jgi:hypothetical protein
MTHRIALGGSMLLALALVYGPATNAQSKKRQGHSGHTRRRDRRAEAAETR